MDNQDYKLNSSFSYLVILAVLIALGVAGRLLPHPPNFTPMAAIALFAGFIFVKRYMAIVAVVLQCCFVTILLLAHSQQTGSDQSPCLLFIWLCFSQSFSKTSFKES